jgi:uncharacterized protein (TIGR02996 family)
MGIEEVLLRDIIDHPDDDTPRLVYADWLEEHGPPQVAERAEFIRLQCQLGQMPEEADDRPDLERRCRVLLRRHRSEWLGTLAAPEFKARFRRGFVDHVDIDAARFCQEGDGLLSGTTVRQVTLVETRPEAFAVLTTVEALGRLNGLGVRPPKVRPVDPPSGYPVASGNFTGLVHSPHLSSLRALDISGWRFQQDDCQALGSSPRLERLERLSLAGTLMPLESVAAIANSSRLPRLDTFDLSTSELGERGMRALAEATLPSLTALLLPHTPLTQSMLSILVTSPLFPRLSSLDIRADLWNMIDLSPVLATAPAPPRLRDLRITGSAGLSAFLQSPLAASLTSLQVPGQRLTRSGLEHLLANLRCFRLHTLTLNRNNLGAGCVEALERCPAIQQLRTLDLEGNTIGLAGVRLLGSSRVFARLRLLDLGNNSIGTMGVRALAESPHLTRLQDLRLNWCQVGDEGVEIIASSPTLRNLAALNLKGNHIGDTGGRLLADSPYLEGLQTLELQANHLSRRTRRMLVDRFGAGACSFEGPPYPMNQ